MDTTTFMNHVRKLSENMKRDNPEKVLNPTNFINKITIANKEKINSADTFFEHVISAAKTAKAEDSPLVDGIFTNMTWSSFSKSSAIESIVNVCKYVPLSPLFKASCESSGVSPEDVITILEAARKNYKYLKKEFQQKIQPDDADAVAAGEKRPRKQPYWTTELEALKVEVADLKAQLETSLQDKAKLQHENIMLEHSITMHKEFADRMMLVFKSSK